MKKGVRDVNNIVIHCSGSFANAKSIQAYFLRPRDQGGRGWKTGGYHTIIDTDGTVNQMYDYSRVTNGVLGNNSDTIHICYVGGVVNIGTPSKPIWKAKDTRTDIQKVRLHEEVAKAILWLKNNGKDVDKSLGVVGHRDYSPDLNKNGIIDPRERIKECPSFEVMPEFSEIYASKDRFMKLPTEK